MNSSIRLFSSEHHGMEHLQAMCKLPAFAAPSLKVSAKPNDGPLEKNLPLNLRSRVINYEEYIGIYQARL